MCEVRRAFYTTVCLTFYSKMWKSHFLNVSKPSNMTRTHAKNDHLELPWNLPFTPFQPIIIINNLSIFRACWAQGSLKAWTQWRPKKELQHPPPNRERTVSIQFAPKTKKEKVPDGRTKKHSSVGPPHANRGNCEKPKQIQKKEKKSVHTFSDSDR